MKLLEVNNIYAFYDKVPAIQDITLNVKEGELICIVGSNGAGKSTILKVICGLIRCKSGSTYFAGQRIDASEPHEIAKNGIAYVQEGRMLFTSMTVLENLEIGAYVVRDNNSTKKTLKLVFSLFPVLAERKNQLSSTLSGGEQQMLAIGRGLMAQPRLIIFDEPSLGLSPILVKELFETIVRINDEDITILLVEQNVFSALRICHRAYVLEKGSIVLEGSGSKLIGSPLIKTAYLGL